MPLAVYLITPDAVFHVKGEEIRPEEWPPDGFALRERLDPAVPILLNCANICFILPITVEEIEKRKKEQDEALAEAKKQGQGQGSGGRPPLLIPRGRRAF